MLKLNFFLKKWTFIRHVSYPELMIQGSAEFKHNGELLENGQYQLCNSKQECYQTHFYQINEDKFLILKSDQSLLHVFPIQDFPNFHHTHLCGEDSYACDFKIIDDKHFEVFYAINGPKKKYIIHTKYIKES